MKIPRGTDKGGESGVTVTSTSQHERIELKAHDAFMHLSNFVSTDA